VDVSQFATAGWSALLLALMQPPSNLARDFILFCVNRCGNCWPALYDEMCRVAGSRLFKNMGYSELSQAGLSLALDDIDRTAELIDEILPPPPVGVLQRREQAG